MANTYTQLNHHVIFAVKGRENIITPNFRDKLFEYISGILKNIENYPLAVNGYKDHVHIFFESNPKNSLAEVVKNVKSNSSKWINENKFIIGNFQWQNGYSGFSYSKSQRNNVIKYIINQNEHHKEKSFKEEYLEILKIFDVEFDERYLFEFYEEY